MTVHPTFPGVYVQEVPSGVRTIMGVSTSTALFIGRAARGPLFNPVRCTTYTDFVNAFSDDTSLGALPSYVKLFFLNGGTDCYVMRIANGAKQSSVTLENDAGTGVLTLTAKDAGVAGEQIRAAVTYNGLQPEITFNLDLFRWAVDSAGNRTKQGAESFKNLSMNPKSPLFVGNVVTQNSKLVSAQALVATTTDSGFSLSGLSGAIAADFLPSLQGANFQISIGGSPYVNVALPTGLTAAGAAGSIQTAINNGFAAALLPQPSPNVSFSGTGSTRRLLIAAANPGDDVLVRSGSAPDMCVPLMMGTANGGLEVGAWARLRPAANGTVFDVLDGLTPPTPTATGLDNLTAMAPTSITLDMLNPGGAFVTQQITFLPAIVATDPVRQKLAAIALAINTYGPSGGAVSKWRADVWGSRLALIPTTADDNYVGTAANFQGVPAALNNEFRQNVQSYSLGTSGRSTAPAKQTPGNLGSDGTPPQATDYDAAYLVIDKEVDLFNLMVLPPDATVAMSQIYPNASVFCQQRRAFLLMDPPPTWSGAQQPTMPGGVDALRIGLVKDYSALFYPRLVIDDKGTKVNIGPSGAIAGLCARIDGTRGVFKAPAGTEADLRGILGVEQRFSDGENGILNPRAINTIRVFPTGIVNWGARTMDGDDDFASEYKYIPIRRLALFIEESLYRGLKWVVFEPNDEPLYSQIRLNVGSFMHDLFRQGAFQGSKPSDAYFVKCDGETTTQSDRDKGIVNIWVGFAPLKPAEFVIIYLQQMAGQIQV